MKITIEPTGHIVEYNGAPAHVWLGKTPSGMPAILLVRKFSLPTHVPKVAEHSDPKYPRYMHPCAFCAGTIFSGQQVDDDVICEDCAVKLHAFRKEDQTSERTPTENERTQGAD